MITVLKRARLFHRPNDRYVFLWACFTILRIPSPYCDHCLSPLLQIRSVMCLCFLILSYFFGGTHRVRRVVVCE